jgi:acyl-CoA reductase-like NAD-dependent aldehyde dehydrogenase
LGIATKMATNKLQVNSPYDGSLIEEMDMHSSKDAESMLAKAKELFDNKSKWISAHQRIEILENLIKLMEENTEDLIKTAASEGGKPYQDSKIEINRAISGIKIAIHEIGNIKGEQIPMGLTSASTQRIAFTIKEPIGVVFAISAFNHPLNLVVHQTVTAFAVGCPVIIKPASTTPLSCIKFCKLFLEAGAPQGWIQYLISDNEIAEKIATDTRIGFLSFIGSAKVGWYLKSKLAHGTRCGLEHGGVAPVIVEDDVLIDDIIEPLCKGSFYHAGQVCVSVQRIFAKKEIAKKLAEKIAQRGNAMKVGHPLEKDTEIGPLISKNEVNRIHEWVKEAEKEGAEIICGGDKISDTCYSPTVLWNPSLKSKVSQEEIFGPVVCITPFETLDEAIIMANDVKYHFQSAIFTSNLDNAWKGIKGLNCTAVLINDHTAFRVDWMPFGGRDVSGEGLGGIPYVMHELTRIKLMVFKNSEL